MDDWSRYLVGFVGGPTKGHRQSAEHDGVSIHLVLKVSGLLALFLLFGAVDNRRGMLIEAAHGHRVRYHRVMRVEKSMRTDLDQSDKNERPGDGPPKVLSLDELSQALHVLGKLNTRTIAESLDFRQNTTSKPS